MSVEDGRPVPADERTILAAGAMSQADGSPDHGDQPAATDFGWTITSRGSAHAPPRWPNTHRGRPKDREGMAKAAGDGANSDQGFAKWRLGAPNVRNRASKRRRGAGDEQTGALSVPVGAMKEGVGGLKERVEGLKERTGGVEGPVHTRRGQDSGLRWSEDAREAPNRPTGRGCCVRTGRACGIHA
jgi:hypothetical protein